MAEIAPRKNPWAIAYSGAVTGAQVFLKMVASAITKPDSAPPHTYSPIDGLTAPSAPKVWCHEKAPVSTTSSSIRPVLLTVPLMVIVPVSPPVTTRPLPRSRKVDSWRAGLPLRMGTCSVYGWGQGYTAARGWAGRGRGRGGCFNLPARRRRLTWEVRGWVAASGAACSRTIDMGGRGFRSPALWDCISRRLVFRGGRFVAFPAWRNSRRLAFSSRAL